MDHNDPHFRYKMPMITAKVEGSGNGIKTVCTNIAAVSKSLGRPPAYAIKYFGSELGANVKIDQANDMYIINGQHDAEKLLNLLYGFIKRFVLCSKCSNPETNLSIEKKSIGQKCLACGYATTIPKVHNLCKYIMNHPPGEEAGAQRQKTGKSRKDKGGKNKTTKNENDSGNDLNNSNNSGEGGPDKNSEDEFDDEELTATAYSERMRELCKGLNNDVYLSDPKESANAFFLLLKEKIEEGLVHDSETHKFLLSEATRLNIRDKAPLILSELLFTENMLDQIKEHRILFLRFCNENIKAQKYLMGGFEKLVGEVYKDELKSKTLLILKTLYDEDILEEEAILEWSQKVSKKYVPRAVAKEIHELVEPFIKWLKEAEEETDSEGESSPQTSTPHSDEDDDDDGVDLEFSHRVQGIQEVSETVTESSKKEEEDLDDLIDEI